MIILLALWHTLFINQLVISQPLVMVRRLTVCFPLNPTACILGCNFSGNAFKCGPANRIISVSKSAIFLNAFCVALSNFEFVLDKNCCAKSQRRWRFLHAHISKPVHLYSLLIKQQNKSPNYKTVRIALYFDWLSCVIYRVLKKKKHSNFCNPPIWTPWIATLNTKAWN